MYLVTQDRARTGPPPVSCPERSRERVAVTAQAATAHRPPRGHVGRPPPEAFEGRHLLLRPRGKPRSTRRQFTALGKAGKAAESSVSRGNHMPGALLGVETGEVRSQELPSGPRASLGLSPSTSSGQASKLRSRPRLSAPPTRSRARPLPALTPLPAR